MKKLILLIPATILALFLTGCYTNVIDVEDNGDGDGKNKGLVISERSQLDQQVFAESQICEVKFSSESSWNIRYQDEQTRAWITISPSSSESGGSFTLSIGVDENSSGNHRYAELQLFSGNQTETIIINQSPIYKDGSLPLPYEPDVYTDIVDKIVMHTSQNSEVKPSTSEWLFNTYFSSGQVNSITHLSTNPNEEENKILGIVSINNYQSLDRDIYGFMQPQGWDVTHRQHSEVTVNLNNFITHEKVTEFNFRQDQNPEPIHSEVTYRYSDYRRVSTRHENNIHEYKWTDGNMVEWVDVNAASTLKFTYGTRNNDRANIDLNTFLDGDIYAAVGLFGKRSKNLISSIADYKGGIKSFDYSFDEKGRVQTVTIRFSVNGVTEPDIAVYTIYYLAPSDNGGDDGSR